MCQRRQKSWMVRDVYGASKLAGSSNPRSSEMPMAMSA